MQKNKTKLTSNDNERASDCSVELKWKGGMYLFGGETRLNGLQVRHQRNL